MIFFRKYRNLPLYLYCAQQRVIFNFIESKKWYRTLLKLMKKVIIIINFIWYVCILTAQVVAEDRFIIIIKSENVEPYNEAYTGFLDVLKGANINLKTRLYELDQQNQSITHVLKEIKQNSPDLILTIGTRATQEIKKSIHNIPIIFSMVLNPEAQGLNDSTNYLPKNLVGVCLDIPLEIQLNTLLISQLPLRRIAVLYQPGQDSAIVAQMKRMANLKGFELILGEIQSEEKIPSVLKDIRYISDVLWLLHNPQTISYSSLKYIMMFCIANNFPVIGLSEHHVKTGALLALRADYHENGRQAGELAIAVLRQGLIKNQTIVSPRKIKLFINKRAAEVMGITIPNVCHKQADLIYEQILEFKDDFKIQ